LSSLRRVINEQLSGERAETFSPSAVGREITRSRLLRYKDALVVTTLYVFATWMTNAHFMADTTDYVDSVLSYMSGNTNRRLWEFGHLVWRPLGWSIYQIFRFLIELVIGENLRAGVTLGFVAFNWLAGLVGALSLYGILRRVCVKKWAVWFTVFAFIFSHGFLNFAQTGTSYLAGLAFLLLGIYFLSRDWPTNSESSNKDKSQARDGHERRSRGWASAAAAGASLAIAVCMWLPFVWVIPAAIISPFLLFGIRRRTWREAARAAIFFVLFTSLMYGSALLAMKIYSPEEAIRWARSSPSIGVTETRGATRMVFGLARSFINMGNDGLLFKRYLLRDPFNPVSPVELLPSLMRLIFFYAVLASISIILLIRGGARERRILALLVSGCAPVVLFAVFFDGGALERYLPLYPFFFLALAAVFNVRGLQPLKELIILFVIAASSANIAAMWNPALGREQEKQAARLSDLTQVLKPHSRVYAVNWQDAAVNFYRSFPFHPLNAQNELQLSALVTPGTASVPHWRKDFAVRALAAWQAGGDVWLSRRAFAERPQSEWNWTEGDDRRVSWPDFSRFFSDFEFGETVGGSDGFVRLINSPANVEKLRRIVETEN
jgi:hypothetical protein